MQDLPTKEEIVEKALKYESSSGALAYSKGFAEAVRCLLPFIVDFYRSKIEKLIN